MLWCSIIPYNVSRDALIKLLIISEEQRIQQVIPLINLEDNILAQSPVQNAVISCSDLYGTSRSTSTMAAAFAALEHFEGVHALAELKL